MKSEYIVVDLNTTQFTNLLFNFINKSKQDSSINVIFRIIDKAKQVINLFEDSSNNYYCMRLLSDSFDYLTGSKSKDHWSLSSRDPHSYARYDSISLLDSLFNSFYFLKLGNNLKDLIQNFVKSSKTSGNRSAVKRRFCASSLIFSSFTCKISSTFLFALSKI